MPRNEKVGVKLMVADKARAEGMQLMSDGSFTSVDGGWLPNSGGWIKTVDGCMLSTEIMGKGKRIGALLDFDFETARENDNGRFHHDDGGDANRWYVVSTSP